MPKTFTAQDFEAAFQAALPGAAKTMKNKVDDRASKGLVAASLFDGNVQGTFCKNFPKIESFLNLAINSIGWFFPAQAALAKAFLAAVKTTLLPVICPTE